MRRERVGVAGREARPKRNEEKFWLTLVACKAESDGGLAPNGRASFRWGRSGSAPPPPTPHPIFTEAARRKEATPAWLLVRTALLPFAWRSALPSTVCMRLLVVVPPCSGVTVLACRRYHGVGKHGPTRAMTHACGVISPSHHVPALGCQLAMPI